MPRKDGLLSAWDKLAGFVVPTVKERQEFEKISRRYGLKMVLSQGKLTIPPLIDILQHKRASQYYLRIDADRKLYKFHATYTDDTFYGTPKDYWVYEMEFGNELPYFIIDSIFNRVKIARIFTEFQEIELEGDFSEFFRLYVPSDDHVNALAVIGPDFMDSLYSFWEYIDVFVAGKRAWLVSRYGTDDKLVQTMIDAGELVFAELDHSAKSHKYVSLE